MSDKPKLNEAGYILIHSLASIRAASTILRSASPMPVPEDEFKQVMSLLWSWQEQLSDQSIEATDDDDPAREPKP